jgi:hypothetical protein
MVGGVFQGTIAGTEVSILPYYNLESLILKKDFLDRYSTSRYFLNSMNVLKFIYVEEYIYIYIYI